MFRIDPIVKCLKRDDMFLGISIFLFIVLSACNDVKKELSLSYEIEEIEIDGSGVLALNNSSEKAGRSYGGQFVKSNGQVVICGLYSSSSVYYYNIQENRQEIIPLPILFDYEKDRIQYNENYITLFHGNNLFSYDIRAKNLDTLSRDLLSSGEFLRKELYGGGIYKENENYILNYGKVNGGKFDNFVDTQAAYIVKKDTAVKDLPYTKEFDQEYVHYSELLPAQDSLYVYYTFSVIPKLVKYDLRKREIVKLVDIPEYNRYLKYDPEKLTDMTYLTTYSYNTAYNLRVFNMSDFIVLLTYTPAGKNTPSNNEWKYSLNFYDKNLNRLDEVPVNTPFLRNYVVSKDNSLYFTNIPNNKIYVYSFSKDK